MSLIFYTDQMQIISYGKVEPCLQIVIRLVFDTFFSESEVFVCTHDTDLILCQCLWNAPFRAFNTASVG